jgi:hypothetical protein
MWAEMPKLRTLERSIEHLETGSRKAATRVTAFGAPLGKPSGKGPFAGEPRERRDALYSSVTRPGGSATWTALLF